MVIDEKIALKIIEEYSSNSGYAFILCNSNENIEDIITALMGFCSAIGMDRETIDNAYRKGYDEGIQMAKRHQKREGGHAMDNIEKKFRVWDKNENRMRYSIDISGDYTERNGELDLLNMFQSLSQRYIFMIFTGFFDKIGNEIFEGDIYESYGERYIVRFGICPDTGTLSAYLENTKADSTTYVLKSNSNGVVVGNIYEK